MLTFDIYIHDNHRHRVGEIIKYWSKQTGVYENEFTHIYFKRDKVNTKRKNVGNSYFGIIKINVKQSSDLNRKISGWTNGIIKSV